MPTYPVPNDHFAGGKQLNPPSTYPAGEGLPDFINDLNERATELESGISTPATLSASGALPAGQVVVLATASGAVTATLPLAADSLGREVFITRSGANNGIVQRAGADTIGPAATSVTLAADGDGITLVAISSNRWARKAVVS